VSNKEKKLDQNTYLAALVGQAVRIAFVDGEVIKAVYVTADRYNLFVKVDDRVCMVCKHAVKWIWP
jgi:sRNA-binding regulator protein Hfq